MCPFVEKKRKKALCLVLHLSTKKPPTLFFQPRPTPLFFNPIQPPYYSNPPIINNYYNVQPPIIPIPPIIRDSGVVFCNYIS